MKTVWKKRIGTLISLALLVASAGTVSAQTVDQTKVNTYAGILIDEDCSGTSDPVKHTKACSQMPGCEKSGYGIDISRRTEHGNFTSSMQPDRSLQRKIF